MKDSLVFTAFFFIFLAIACAAFWIWLFHRAWVLGVAGLFSAALAIVAVIYRAHAKKYTS